MLKNLIEKRAALIAQYDEIKGKLETEKRSAYSNDEMTSINNIKSEIEEIERSIEVEKEMQAKRNVKLDAIASVNIQRGENKNLVNEFRSFLSTPNSGEQFTVPFEYTSRAAVTTSANPNFKYTDQNAGISINDSDLVLPKLGVKTFYFDSGAVDFPSLSQIVGTFGTEDNSVSDQAFSDAKKTLTPTFVSASIEVSEVFLKSSKDQNIAELMAELKYAVDKALERRTLDTFGTLSPIASGATGVSTTFHNASVQMEAEFMGAPSGYIFSASGIARAKNSKIDSGSGILVYQNGMINGYPAMRSTLQSNANHGYLIASNAVAQAYWGEGVQVKVITDSTLARKGSVLLIASALADGSYLDANKIAVIKNVHKLS